MGKMIMSQPRTKYDGSFFDVPNEIVIDVNVTFLVIVHSAALADLDYGKIKRLSIL